MLAIAALSARALVDAAALEGLPTVALDLFGDVDTRRAARAWLPIGEPASMAIDGERLLQALDALAARGDVTGWIAGSGFDGDAALLARGAERLPLIGTAAADVQRVRNPADFFAQLRAAELPHPEIRFEAPAQAAGWLLKDAGSCGGAGVRRAEDVGSKRQRPCEGERNPQRYWQREVAGQPMSATFVANRQAAVVLGFNRQTVQPQPGRPFLFSGVQGPVPVHPAVQRVVDAALQRLAAEYRLAGLGSLDFMADGETAWLLELNPRAPASTSLYPRVGDAGPLRAHLQACLHGGLPPARASASASASAVNGHTIVYARRPMRVDDSAAQLIAGWPGAHDLPAAGTRLSPGEPLCSLCCSGIDADDVGHTLDSRRAGLLHTLETAV